MNKITCASCNMALTSQADCKQTIFCSICEKPIHKDCVIKEEEKLYCDTCYTIKTEEKSTYQTEITIPEVIRRSYIELYRACPYSFYQQVIKGTEVPFSCFAQVGIDLHEIFYQASLHQVTNKEDAISLFKPMFEGYNDELFENDLHLYKNKTLEELKQDMWKKSVSSLTTFFDIVLPQLPTTAFALEEKIVFDVGSKLPKVSITMDRIDEVDGELEISDWKTGSVMVGNKISNDLQAPLYIYAIRKHFDKPVRKFTFYYLDENKVRVFERVTEDNYTCKVIKKEYKINITEQIQGVQKVFEQIQKGRFNIKSDFKSMYFTCKMCGLKKMEICKGAEDRVWRGIK